MIDPEKVQKVFNTCLFRKEEVVNGKPKPEMIEVQGLRSRYGLHKERVGKNKEEITGFLKELPEEFSQGKGRSFLHLCKDKDGKEQTGLRVAMEELICLGIAIKKVVYSTPKETWAALPGGMPYVTIKI